MRLKFFTIPIMDPGEAEGEVNAFLARHRILTIDRELVKDSSGACWSVCVSYQDGKAEQIPAASRGKSKIDYREVLSPAEFEVYADMRRWRKDVAAKDGVPPYQVFNNEQLAAIVQQRIRSIEELSRLSGVGPARVSRYGQAILERFDARVAGLNGSPQSVERDAPNPDPAGKHR